LGVFELGLQVPDPVTGRVAEGIAAQAEQALKNVGAILESAGCSWKDVVKVTLWLTNAEHYPIVNDIYARFVGDPPPARSAPIVAGIPRGFLISIEAIAKR